MSNVAKEIGLDGKKVQEVGELLSILLANVHGLFLKTLSYHWNMVDPRFFFLHELLDSQYNALVEDMDSVAERMRKLGLKAPASLKEFKKLATIADPIEPATADEMLKDLLASYDEVIRAIRKDADTISQWNDIGTVDMLTQIIREFEKRAWILRSHFTK